MKYPEHEKMKKILDEGEDYPPIHIPINRLLADYFGIDLNKVEEEKRQMLEENERK